MSDESLTGDPMGYITASQLSDFILDLDANFATEETSVADVDKFFFHDVSADAMRYITKADLATELGGESSYVGPPASIWWMTAENGTTQSERLPVTAPQDIHTNFARMPRFSGGAADETFNGGIGTVTWSNANEHSDNDLSAQNVPDSVFQLPAGTWHIFGKFYTNSSAQAGVVVVLRSIESGADDAVVIHRPGHSLTTTVVGVSSSIITIFEPEYEYLVLTASKTFYWQFVGALGDLTASGYMQIKKVD